MQTYQSMYTWHHPLNEHIVAHSDGRVSCYLSYRGIDPTLKTQNEQDDQLQALRSFMNNLPEDVTCEFHLWRGKNREVMDRYLANAERTIRGHEFANHARQCIAEQLYPRSASNRVGLVLSMAPKFWEHLWGKVSAKEKLIVQVKLGNRLLNALDLIDGTLPDLKLEPLDVYGQAVWRSYNRDYFDEGVETLKEVKTHHALNEQWASIKPDFIAKDNIHKIGDTYCWSGILKQTPDLVDPHWFYNFIRTIRGGAEGVAEIELHVSHVMQKTSAGFAANKAEQAAYKTQETNSVAGGTENRGKAGDEVAFAHEVSDKQLKVFRHVFQIQLYSKDYEFLKHRVKDLKKWFATERQNAELVNNSVLAESVWRNAMPGQGYLNTFWPQHSHLYVSCMVPSVQFDQGHHDATSMQVTQDGELIGLDYPTDDTSHAMISGNSGVGKGVRKSVEVIEFGSIGWDWYILEVGQTHRWTVEHLGGRYVSLDPDYHVINPFPNYADVKRMCKLLHKLQKEKGVKVEEDALPKDIVVGTVQGISFTFLGPGGFANLPEQELVFYECVAQAAMLALYAPGAERSGSAAPNLQDYFFAMETIGQSGLLKPPQQKAADAMLAHLEAYLDTEVGKIFKQDNNLSIEAGIVGIDFEPLRENEALYRAFLTFVCMRFGQLTFTSEHPSRVLLEEVHNAKGIDPKAISKLARDVALMGRKASAAIELSGQDISQFQFADKSNKSDTDSQIDYVQLFYTKKYHADVAETYGLPEPVLTTWKSFQNPKRCSKPYRDILLSLDGHWYEILGSQPEFVLQLVNTSNKAILNQKALISEQVPPEQFMERFDRLRAWQASNPNLLLRQDANEESTEEEIAEEETAIA